MAVTSFEMDDRTLETIDKLKELFGVRTNAAVLRKAVTLALIAGRHADANRTVVIGAGDDKETVSLAG